MTANAQEKYPPAPEPAPANQSAVEEVSLDDALPSVGTSTKARVSDEEWSAFTTGVKAANPIEDIVALDATLERRGDELVCSSPLRSDDDSPSFGVSVSKQLWLDRGTGAGGDVFAYVMERRGLTFVEARRWLAERAGIRPPTGTLATPAEQEVADERHRVEAILTDAANAYHEALDGDRRDFLRAHYGFTDKTIDDEKLGYDPGGTYLWYALKAKGHEDEHLFQTGLFVERAPTLGSTYFHHRLTFPYWRRGRAVYFCARATRNTPQIPVRGADGIVTKHRDPPKYLKLTTRPDDPVSDREPSEVSIRSSISATISNEWFAGEDACDRPCDLLVIAEGMPDYLSLKQLGYAVISPVTTTFRRADQPKLLRLSERAKTILLIPDQERSGAGVAGAMDTATVLARGGRDARIATLPHSDVKSRAEATLATWVAEQAATGRTVTDDEKTVSKLGDWKVDANEFVRDHAGGDAMRAVIRTALPLVEYLIADVPGVATGRELDERLRPLLELIAREPAALERERLLDVIRTRFRVRRPVLDAMFADAARKKTPPGHATDSTPREASTKPSSGKPRIVVSTDLEATHNAAIAALAGDPVLYRRGSDPRERLARVVNSQIDLLPAECLPERLTTAADWVDAKGPTLPSDRTTRAIYARGSYPGLRQLRGVVRQPTLLKDGRVLTAPGYDPGSCLIYEPDGLWPDLPAMPEGEAELRTLALKAKANLDEVVEDFPFVAPSKAVWLALVLTIEARFFVDGPLPQFAFTANVPGAGKGALVKLAGIITTGDDPEARALPVGANAEEELEKRLTGIAIAGTPLVFFDEVAAVDSKNLQRVATSRVYAGRILGATGDYKGRIDSVVAYAGNNMVIAGDMGRRVLPCCLESPYEDPSKRPARTYKHPERAGEGGTLLAWCAERRRQLHIDALTLIRAFLLAKPKHKIGAFGSFEEWAGVVAACLVWLGEPDITATVGRIEDDPQRNALGAVLGAWHRAFGGAQVWAADVVRYLESNIHPPGVAAEPTPETVSFGEKALEDPRQSLAAALRDVCQCRDGFYPTVQALGGWLGRVRNRPVAGLKITADYDSHRKQNAWKLSPVLIDPNAAGISPQVAGISSADTRTGGSQKQASAGIAGICGYHLDPPHIERTHDVHHDDRDRERPHIAHDPQDTGEEIPAMPAASAVPIVSDTYVAGTTDPAKTDTRSRHDAAEGAPSAGDVSAEERAHTFARAAAALTAAQAAVVPAATHPVTSFESFPDRPTRTVRGHVTSAAIHPWPLPSVEDEAWPPPLPGPGRLIVVLQLEDGTIAYSVHYGHPFYPERVFAPLRPFGWDGRLDARGLPTLERAPLSATVQLHFQLGFGDVWTVIAVCASDEPRPGASFTPALSSGPSTAEAAA